MYCKQLLHERMKVVHCFDDGIGVERSFTLCVGKIDRRGSRAVKEQGDCDCLMKAVIGALF